MRLKNLLGLAVAAAMALASTDGWAQANPPVPPPFAALGGQTTISATNTSSRVALPASVVAFGAVTVYNASTTVDAYVALGGSTVVALSSAGTCAAPTFTMCLVKAGTSIVVWAGSNTYVAGITASSTASLVIYQGSGGVQLSAIYSGTSPPSGPAGGDLSGTYPNPTVAQASAGFALPSSALTFSGNITGAAIFGTNGIKVKTTSGTLSDTTSTGTVATNYNNLFGGNTQTATSATTITNNYGSYYVAPVCSTNVTCTANWALGADSLVVGTSQGFTVSTAGGLTAAGITSSNGRLSVSGSRSQGAWGTSGVSSINSGSTLTDSSSSGTVAVQYAFALKAPTIAANSSTTFTNSYNTYVENPVAGTNVTQTNAYALGADSLNVAGSAVFSGGISLASNNINTVGVLKFGSSGDTGLSRDSVLGALNVDLGNGSANDKSGTLNAAKVALGGCTIGTDNFCITGSASISGNINANGNFIKFGGTGLAQDGGGNLASVNTGNNAYLPFAALGLKLGANRSTFITSPSDPIIQLGAADAAAPVAQTLGVQNVVAGTTNTAGVVTTILNSAGTGTALGGNTVFKYAPHDVTHTVNTFTGSASPYTIGFTAGNITTYPVGTVMTVSGCTTATLNGTYTVTASSSGSVTATTSATGTGSPTTCVIVGNTSQNAFATALTINGDTAAVTAVGNMQAANLTSVASITAGSTGNLLWSSRALLNSPADGTVSAFFNDGSTYGALKFATLISAGAAPTGSGTCTRGAQTGGQTAGTIVLTCTAQTLILTFTTTAPNGWMCEAIDQTTTADTMKQTSNTTTSCTLTGTTAASDVILFQARAF